MSFVTLFNSKNKLTQFTIKKKRGEERRGEEREREREKRPRRHIETLMTTPLVPLEKYEETNLITPRKVNNNDRSGSHEPFKYVKAHLPLDGSCCTLRSPLVTFLYVI
jgi:hypothetical protein